MNQIESISPAPNQPNSNLPNSHNVKQGQACKICKKGYASRTVVQIDENISIEGVTFPKRVIFKKVISSIGILSKIHTRNLERPNFAPKFCEKCIERYGSPNFFESCQNKLCQKEVRIEANLSLQTLSFSIACIKNNSKLVKLKPHDFASFVVMQNSQHQK